jgi:hypothetical protein
MRHQNLHQTPVLATATHKTLGTEPRAIHFFRKFQWESYL